MSLQSLGWPQTVLIATGDKQTGEELCSEFGALGCTIAGPFTSNAQAVEWLATGRPDVAVVDALMTDGAALRLAMQLQQKGIQFVFFAAYDPAKRTIRAELPDSPGKCRDTSIRELLRAFA
jgi:DNA-binding NarL/FixJ family response regulator